jgi:AAA+ ATPase superfamily predicted ATPase
MRFLDRQLEMERLDRLVVRRAAGLVALWGRRRVGKTRLLSQWCQKHDGLYTVADQSAESVQRRYFAEAINEKLPGFNDVEYPDWSALLRRLSSDSRAAGWKGPLVFDEFPHLVVASPSLPSIMQNWVDREAAMDGLLIAIAGSSQTMMQGLVLDSSAPLYGRATEAFTLPPIPAGWIGEAIGDSDPVASILAYAVWGGIPRYWELAAPFGSALDDAVDALALDPLGPLHMEPDRLLREETPSAMSLRPLLDVIGNGSNRLSEIAGRLGCQATSLSRPISRLQELGLVTREVPFGETEKSSKRALYRMSDPFCAFWFRVVAPHRGFLASASPAARKQIWTQAKPALVAHTWEVLCRAAIPALSSSNGPALISSGITQQPNPFDKLRAGKSTTVSPIPSWLPASRWWQGAAPEWDVMLATMDGREGAVGEVKWAETPFDDAAIGRIVKNMAGRSLPPKLPRSVERFVFVPTVCPKTALVNNGVQVITAAQVLGALR